jgi:hypothetical protein
VILIRFGDGDGELGLLSCLRDGDLVFVKVKVKGKGQGSEVFCCATLRLEMRR